MFRYSLQQSIEPSSFTHVARTFSTRLTSEELDLKLGWITNGFFTLSFPDLFGTRPCSDYEHVFEDKVLNHCKYIQAKRGLSSKKSPIQTARQELIQTSRTTIWPKKTLFGYIPLPGISRSVFAEHAHKSCQFLQRLEILPLDKSIQTQYTFRFYTPPPEGIQLDIHADFPFGQHSNTISCLTLFSPKKILGSSALRSFSLYKKNPDEHFSTTCPKRHPKQLAHISCLTQPQVIFFDNTRVFHTASIHQVESSLMCHIAFQAI